MIYPISYSFPDHLWVDTIPEKTQVFASYAPNIRTTNVSYQHNSADEYLAGYRKSIFGISSKKCGWDCYRHLEIISQGAFLFMQDIDKIPMHTMTHYPKQLIKQNMEKYGFCSMEHILKHSSSTIYDDLQAMLATAKRTLTSTSMMTYLLQVSGHASTKKLLFSISQNDYIGSSLHYAGKRLYGNSFVDVTVNKENFSYDMYYDDYPLELTKPLYGRGFNYTRNTNASLKSNTTFEDTFQSIKDRDYETIIINKENPHLATLLQYYEPHEIIVFCGSDCSPLNHPTAGWITHERHYCDFLYYLQRFEKHHPIHRLNVFVRELGE